MSPWTQLKSTNTARGPNLKTELQLATKQFNEQTPPPHPLVNKLRERERERGSETVRERERVRD